MQVEIYNNNDLFLFNRCNIWFEIAWFMCLNVLCTYKQKTVTAFNWGSNSTANWHIRASVDTQNIASFTLETKMTCIT